MTQPHRDVSFNITTGRLSSDDALAIIDSVYARSGPAREILIHHGRQVARKALQIARHLAALEVDLEFLESAALLHDIGMIHTHAPILGCHGPHPYLRHGVLGREMLEPRGILSHALVCERHVGAGLSRETIVENGLDLPVRDMRPRTLEEQIICYADKFFSKTPGSTEEKSIDDILAGLIRHGSDQAKQFSDWVELFEGYPDDGQEQIPG